MVKRQRVSSLSAQKNDPLSGTLGSGQGIFNRKHLLEKTGKCVMSVRGQKKTHRKRFNAYDELARKEGFEPSRRF